MIPLPDAAGHGIEEARAAWRAAPRDPQAANRLAALLVQAGQRHEALAVLEEASAAPPLDLSVVINRAGILNLLGRRHGALALYDAIRRALPGQPHAEAGRQAILTALGGGLPAFPGGVQPVYGPVDPALVFGLPFLGPSRPAWQRFDEEGGLHAQGATAAFPAGARVRFRTDAPWFHGPVTTSAVETNSAFSEYGAAGVDVWVDGGYLTSFARTGESSNSPVARHHLVDLRHLEPQRTVRSVEIYLPPCAQTRLYEIGLPPGSRLLPPEPCRRRVVFCGTRVTHGLSAPRPSLSYVAQLSRMLEVDGVNFGFSGFGSADGNPVLAEHIAATAADLFVLECSQVAKGAADTNLIPFIESLKARHPAVPILVVTALFDAAETFDPELRALRRECRQDLRDGVRRLAGRYGDLHLIEGLDLIGPDDADMLADGIHPNALGHRRLAEGLRPVIGRILFGEEASPSPVKAPAVSSSLSEPPPATRPQVFVAENLSFIQHFLSLYEPDRDVTVIAGDLPCNHGFFKDFLGLRTIFMSPMMMWGPSPLAPPPPHWTAWLEQLAKVRPRMRRLAQSLPADADVYWWHMIGNMPHFPLLAELRAAGRRVHFVNSDFFVGVLECRYHPAERLGAVHPAYGPFLEAASDALGMKMSFTEMYPRREKGWSHRGIGPDETAMGEILPLAVRPWNEIALRMAGRVRPLTLDHPPAPGRRRVLFVDDLLSPEDGVDVPPSERAVCDFFRYLLDQGDVVHVKAHYHYATSSPTLRAPDLQGRFKTLPSHLPAELYLPHYDVMYTYISSTSFANIPIHKFSLLPLIRFFDPAQERRHWSLLRCGENRGEDVECVVPRGAAPDAGLGDGPYVTLPQAQAGPSAS